MKKIYSLLLLAVALVCLPMGVRGEEQVVFSEGFESNDLSTNGWTKESCHSKSVITTTAHYEGSRSFMFYYNSNPPQYLISKELSIPSGTTAVNVSLYYKCQSSTYVETFQVGYSTTTKETSAFTWDTEVSVSNVDNWQKYTNSITFPVDLKYIAIRYNSNNKYYLYIDDINVSCEVAVSCEKPSTLTQGELTGTSVTYTWTKGGSEEAWQYVCLPAATVVDWSDAAVKETATESATIEGLNPTTSYKFYVRAKCSAEDQSKEISEAFTTPCAVIANSQLPWTENFNDATVGELPLCWDVVDANTTNKGTIGVFSGDWSISLESKALRMNGKSSNGYSYALLPPFEAALNTLQIVFSHKAEDTSSSGKVELGYFKGGEFTLLQAYDQASTMSTILAYPLNALPADAERLAFRYKSNSSYDYAVVIDDVTVELLPACAVPTGLAASEITENSAKIAWTSEATAWKMQISTDGETWNDVAAEITNPYVLTGLTASTKYYVQVCADCGANGDSEWTKAISFTTACAAITVLPWSLNFDAIASDIPECWDRSGSTTPTLSSNPGYIWGVAIARQNSSDKMLRLLNSLIQEGTAVMNTPLIELPASPAYEFNFEYSHRASCGAFTVKVSEDGGANWFDLGSYTNETGGTSGVPADELIEASIDLSSYAGKTIMLQFYAMADWGNGAIFVDNVAVRVKSNCPLPKNVTVSSVTDHTAKVAWTQNGEATAWKLQTSTDGSNWGEEIDANTNPFTLTGLTAETTYYVRVKSACGESEYSDWSDASAAFTTQCEAKSLPFATEGFDAIPSCWSVDPEWELYSYDGSIRVKSYTASLTMPLIVLSEKAQLSFKHTAGANNSVKCQVYVNDGESEEKAEEMYSSTSWKQATVDLSAYTGKTVNIIFRSSSSSYYLYLDDVAVNYLPVAAPTNVAATPADESATVTWECEEATTYAVQYRVNESEDDWTEVADLSAKTYTIEGLTNGTAYEVQVKAIVSENRQSEWTASTIVTPAKCPTVTGIELSEKTFKSVKVSWTASGTGTWVLEYGLKAPYTVVENLAVTEYVLDNLTAGETYTIKVHPNCSEESLQTTYYPAYTAPSNVVVTNISDVTATASWDSVADATLGYTYSVAPRGNQTPWAYSKVVTNETSVNLNLDAGSDYDFYVVTNYPDGWMSPAVKVEFSTITVAPKSISVSEITASSAKLAWENDGAATVYEYALGDDPTALEWNEVAEKTKTLGELAANTSYTFYVRAKYSDKVKSDSVYITFRTECETIVVDAETPFTENFNSLTQVVTIPECWDNAEGTTTSDNYKWRNYSDGHEGACVRFESDYNAKGATNVLATPTIQLNVEATLKFWCKNATGGAFEVKISANGGERETLLSGLTSISSWTEKEVDLSDYTGKSVVLYFCGTSNYATGGLICLDDVNITAIPACGTPKNVQATNVLCNTATITWEKGGKETAWIVEYATNEDFTEGLVEENADATSLALTGLTTNTKYYVRVKGDCESATYSEVINFTPAYIAPSDVAVSEITTTSAQVDWTANSGEAVWTVQYKKAADAEWTSIENVDAHPYVLTNLAAGTNYQVRVLAGEKASSTESFTTGCAIITDLPWSENFEGHPLNAAPACWEVVDPNNTNIYVSTGNTWFDLGTTGLFFEGVNVNYGYILLPEFEAALNTLQISFSHSEEHSSYSGKIELGYYKDDEFTSLKVYDQSQKTWKAEGPFALTDVPAGARLAFGYKTNSIKYAAAIDNITIEEISSCVVPTDLAASAVKATTATLTWTSEAEAFKVQIKAEGEEWGAAQDAATASFNLTELTPNTKYYARVKAVCGLENESEWSAEISFTTDCEAEETPFHETFDAGIPECWKTTGTWAINDEYSRSGKSAVCNAYSSAGTLTTPSVVIPDNTWLLRFFIRNVYGGSYYVSGKVIVTAEGVAPVETPFIESKTLAEQRIDLTAFAGKTITITFSVDKASSTARVYIDDVDVTTEAILTALDNAGAEGAKATKRLENNMLIIELNGVQYNAQGQLLKK